MATANTTWGAPPFTVSFSGSASTWRSARSPEGCRSDHPTAKRGSGPSFLRNHREVLAAMDFFTVPTEAFRVLFFVIHHARRTVLHVGVIEHPTARWIIRRLCEAFPYYALAAIEHMGRVGGLHHRYERHHAA
jgi:hypothetical protein